MTTQTDTIFIQGLPTDINEPMLAQFFGQIGLIKVRCLSASAIVCVIIFYNKVMMNHGMSIIELSNMMHTVCSIPT